MEASIEASSKAKIEASLETSIEARIEASIEASIQGRQGASKRGIEASKQSRPSRAIEAIKNNPWPKQSINCQSETRVDQAIDSAINLMHHSGNQASKEALQPVEVMPIAVEWV